MCDNNNNNTINTLPSSIYRRLSLSDIQEAFGFRLESKKNDTQAPNEIETKWRCLNEKEREQWYHEIQQMSDRERRTIIRNMKK